MPGKGAGPQARSNELQQHLALRWAWVLWRCAHSQCDHAVVILCPRSFPECTPTTHQSPAWPCWLPHLPRFIGVPRICLANGARPGDDPAIITTFAALLAGLRILDRPGSPSKMVARILRYPNDPYRACLCPNTTAYEIINFCILASRCTVPRNQFRTCARIHLASCS